MLNSHDNMTLKIIPQVRYPLGSTVKTLENVLENIDVSHVNGVNQTTRVMTARLGFHICHTKIKYGLFPTEMEKRNIFQLSRAIFFINIV